MWYEYESLEENGIKNSKKEMQGPSKFTKTVEDKNKQTKLDFCCKPSAYQ